LVINELRKGIYIKLSGFRPSMNAVSTGTTAISPYSGNSIIGAPVYICPGGEKG